MDNESFKKEYDYLASTPVMRQYLDVKFAHPDCLVLFRMGDFYELFFEDAMSASQILGITLTKRGKTGEEVIPMCGVPHHALENYLNKLIEAGCKIAICDQIETPEEAKRRGGYKAVVKREVTRIVTPGTVIEEALILQTVPNYLVSLVLKSQVAALCYLDLSTAEINVIEVPTEEVLNQLTLLRPKEILLSEKLRGSQLVNSIATQLKLWVNYQVDSFFAANKCEKIILEFYNIFSSKAIGDLSYGQIASIGSILEYITLTQKQNIPSLSFPKIVQYQNFMNIDAATYRGLEIINTVTGQTKGSLLATIDYTITKAGSRLLYQFLSRPLTNIDEINDRLARTALFYTNTVLTAGIRQLLPQTSDIVRSLARISMNRASARDLLSIKYTLATALAIKQDFINQFGIKMPELIDSLILNLSGDEALYNLIDKAINIEAPATLSDGGFINPEFHTKLKEFYELLNNGKAYIERLKTIYQNETGIDTLKIVHNNVLGLFIEVTVRQSSKMMDPKFIHRQTTSTTARYTTVELQKLESDIINAKSLKVALEQEIYKEICTHVLSHSQMLKKLASSLSEIDVFAALGYCAGEHNYVKPVMKNDISFKVLEGRHPVIERALATNKESFVGNNCALDKENRIWLITGPNMSGKSTFLRQNALITIMAQIGSFVPAKEAEIGIIDKIFSRIGAGDDLLKGQSTFMVEMLEVAAILAQGSAKSLIILDEVGRGTSTYDGVAIAWSVLEYIHDQLKCRCLFATHYYELVNLNNFLPALKNYTVAIEETEGTILFLHRIIQGAADRSYGVHVAELAGLPQAVITRANEILMKLEKASVNQSKKVLKTESNNLKLFEIEG